MLVEEVRNKYYFYSYTNISFLLCMYTYFRYLTSRNRENTDMLVIRVQNGTLFHWSSYVRTGNLISLKFDRTDNNLKQGTCRRN